MERGAWLSSVVLVVLAMLGCKDTPSDRKAGVSTGSAAPASGKTAEDVVTPELLKGSAEAPPRGPAASTAVPEDVAYIGVQGTGVVRVVDGKATTLVKHEHTIRDFAIDAHGIVYATAIGGLWRIEGDKVTELPDNRDHNQPDHLAVGADGTLWALDHHGAYRFDGTAWTQYPEASFGGAELFYDITVDGKGTVWVATTDDLWRFEGATWQRVDKKFTKTRQPYFRAVAARPDSIVVGGGFGVFSGANDVWTKIPAKDRYGALSPDELAASPDGRLAMSGGVDDVTIVPPGGAPKRIDLKKVGANVRKADVMAVDLSGRTWLATDNGVVILDGDGALLQQWKPGTVEGLKGEIEAIAVFGKGPTLPTLTAAARGIVVGKILHNGKPVGGAKVELCASPSMFMDKTPCSDAAVMRTGVTSADGTFSIADVPVGSYGVAVKPKRTWFVTWGNSDCCTELEDGGTFDVGALKLDKLE